MIFVTKYGNRWTKISENGSPDDAIGKEFAKLLIELGFKRKGLSFYCLRHGFETIAGQAGDQIAVDHYMGHVDSSMAGIYRQEIGDDRLEKIAAHVHDWLFPAGGLGND